MASTSTPQTERKKVLKVIFISLLLDLVCAPFCAKASARLIDDLDIIYVHFTTFPEALGILPKPGRSGGFYGLDLESDTLWAKHL